MEEPEWPFTLEEVCKEAKVKSSRTLRNWATLANQLIILWQRDTRTFLVHHFRLRHNPFSWRPILEKLSRNSLSNSELLQ